MDYKKAYAIAIKDMTEIFSSISIYGPMLGVPLFFSVALPILTFYVTQIAGPGIASRFIAGSPVAAQSSASALLFMSYFAISVLGPIFLTMPIFTASVIAADSFAGEKERKTSEALLATPISTSELLFGKIIASFVPTLLLTIAVFIIYGLITNYLALRAFGVAILPTSAWLAMLASAPFLALATIGVVVWVSSHVKGIKEAQQISTLLVLPILIMPFISILGFANLTTQFFEYVIVFLAVLDACVLYLGVRSFRKESIL